MPLVVNAVAPSKTDHEATGVRSARAGRADVTVGGGWRRSVHDEHGPIGVFHDLC